MNVTGLYVFSDILWIVCIIPLKELPRLINLDLTGNNILDGSGIFPKEQAQAKEAYLGCLTICSGEKISHCTLKNISELDLRNCKLREIDYFSPPQRSVSGSSSHGKHVIPELRNFRKLNPDGKFDIERKFLEKKIHEDDVPAPDPDPGDFADCAASYQCSICCS
ncbi:hypothetical protein BJ742DRAFT_875051 [Cladochytrium replicatum]|nr:hypothetical protein BJ742DRAFT_875051 [Cladochytrium replicatum]